jgi:hypothetical protein
MVSYFHRLWRPACGGWIDPPQLCSQTTVRAGDRRSSPPCDRVMAAEANDANLLYRNSTLLHPSNLHLPPCFLSIEYSENRIEQGNIYKAHYAPSSILSLTLFGSYARSSKARVITLLRVSLQVYIYFDKVHQSPSCCCSSATSQKSPPDIYTMLYSIITYLSG